MSTIDPEDEIVQDFLIEAGEILEQLSEQLVDLERNPTDKDLLNAVFRGFHTIKGGASFLNLHELVEVCHSAEDVFNLLRQGDMVADSRLMDYVLKVLDYLNQQFELLRTSASLEAADPELIVVLKRYATGVMEVDDQASPSPASSGKDDTPSQADDKQAADKAFEKILDAAPANTGSTTDTISEEEFDALLDEIHGKPKSAAAPPQPDKAETGGNEKITEEEFEALLDEMQGNSISDAVERSVASPPPAKPALVATPVEVPAEKIGSVPVAQAPKAPPKDAASATGETTVRVDTKRLDDIMNMVGELVLVRNRLVTLENTLGGDDEVAKAVANLDVVTANLQTAVMKTRMQPIKKVFGRFPRVVRDLARSLKKEVLLELQGEDTDLDKNLVEALADPLVHLVRNAVDHGIESPQQRESVGKPRAGTMVLAAEQEGDHILLSIEDDGAGIDPKNIKKKAIENSLIDADTAERLDEKDCFNLIFLPGFSTKQQITDVSGRGVGMDVVKTRISQLNGSIDIDSKLGKGSRFAIKVPLTLAIMPTLMVVLGNQTFALPLVSVSEIFDLDLTSTNNIDGQLVIMVRDKAMPLFFLSKWLVRDRQSEHAGGHVVVVHVGTQKVGFVVDHLTGQEEVVIKPLGALLHGTPGMAGATITGDGHIALILDVPGLMQAYGKKISYAH